MSDHPAEPLSGRFSRKVLLGWAIVATVTAVVFAATSVVLHVLMRELRTGEDGRAAVEVQPEKVSLSTDFSASNAVSVVLGRTEVDGGITHLPDWPDGWTRADALDGVPCRYMNHRAPNLAGGAYLYFAVHPSFKRAEIRYARIEFQYFAPSPVRMKLQYDGFEDGRRRLYKPAGEVLQVPSSASWQSAVFHVAEPAFMNSLHGGADFRLDVSPPEIYVRRVTMTRMSEPPSVTQVSP